MTRSDWSDAFADPAFALMVTALVWVVASRLQKMVGSLLNPVLTSVVAIATMLILADADYSSYKQGVNGLIVLLGPAVVALALPIRRNRGVIRAHCLGLFAGAIAGTVAGVVATVLIAQAAGLGPALGHTLAPKHATSAVSAAVAGTTGGSESLAAVISILTGITGAVFAVPLLRLLRVRDSIVTGLSLGVSAHAIGTARAFDENPTAGAMSAVGMAIAAVAVPLVVALGVLTGAL
jgi:putative effector of murein hydrolase